MIFGLASLLVLGALAHVGVPPRWLFVLDAFPFTIYMLLRRRPLVLPQEIQRLPGDKLLVRRGGLALTLVLASLGLVLASIALSTLLLLGIALLALLGLFGSQQQAPVALLHLRDGADHHQLGDEMPEVEPERLGRVVDGQRAVVVRICF